MWDSKIQGFRLKKRLSGSRYTQLDYHKNEIKLTKILESYFGSSDIVTSFHPLWAKSRKQVLYEYDILVKSEKILIEYNGIQHYKYTPFFHHSRKEFKDRKRMDFRKKILANENGYNLLTIRYDEPIFEDYIITKVKKVKNDNKN